MLDDLRLAWRRLGRAPGFTIAAVLTLALAIGANTAILTVADAVLFRPLPYASPDRVCIVRMSHRATGTVTTMVGNKYIQAIDDGSRTTSEVALVDFGESPVIQGPDGAEALDGVAVTPNYFHLLGVRPIRGRLFEPADLTAPGRPAMLSYGAWQERFAGSESVVGRAMKLGSKTFDIIGVLPAGFVFPSSFVRHPDLVTVEAPPKPGERGGALNPIVRLRPGVTREQAQAQIDTLVRDLAARDTRTGEATPVLQDVRSVLYPAGRSIMRFLLAAAGLVLLVGCANLANLLLARSKRRERDLAARIALGATRSRLVCPIIFEALLVGLAAALLAVIVTWSAFDILIRQVPAIAFGAAPVGMSMRVVLVALALGVLGGIAFGAVPAWRSARLDVQTLLKGGSARDRAGANRAGSAMVAVQVAFAIVLVFGAVVACRAFLSVLRVPLGFDSQNVITARVFPEGLKTGLARQDFYQRVLDGLAHRPGVVSVGAAGSLPLDGTAPDEAVGLPGRRPVAGIVHVLPGYFETAGVPLLRGRLLRGDDARTQSNAAVVEASAARLLFPGRDPLGATFASGKGRLFTVVGVVGDVRTSLARHADPRTYVIPGEATGILQVVVRTRARNDAALSAVKREIGRLAPGTPVRADWWDDDISAVTEYRNPRFQTLVLGSFALLALVLTAIGTFAMVSVLVARRFREMGVRMALGATPRSVVLLMIAQAARPVAVGVLFGVLCTRWLAKLAEAQLFAVDTRNPSMLVATAVTVACAALVAAWIPGRRAGAVDPVVVLRAE